MSDRIRLATGSIGELQALGAFGRPVHSLYAQLRSVVEARLSPRHAALFAEPVLHSADHRMDWYATCDGDAARLTDLPPELAQSALATVRQLSADLTNLAAELGASGNDSDQAVGHLIGLALSTPDDNHVFVVGDQPILTFWGFARRGGTAQTAPLHGYGGQSAQPVAAPVSAAAISRGAVLPWAMWSFAALLLVVAVLLLLRAFGGVSVPGLAWLDGPNADAATQPISDAPEPTLVADRSEPPPVDDSRLLAARERERTLRTELAALDSRYQDARANCPVTQRPPSTALGPDRDVPDRDVAVIRPPQGVDRAEGLTRPDRVTPPRDDDLVADELTTLDPPDATAPDDDVPPDVGPALGAPLTIDDTSRAAEDLAALAGRWRTGPTLMDQGDAAPLEIEYAFDDEGRGRSTIRLEDGVTCEAEAQATYNGPDAIVITELDHPACTDGTEFERSEIVCLIDTDGATLCDGAQAGGSAYPLGFFEAGQP